MAHGLAKLTFTYRKDRKGAFSMCGKGFRELADFSIRASLVREPTAAPSVLFRAQNDVDGYLQFRCKTDFPSVLFDWIDDD